MPLGNGNELTWYGHATWLLKTSGGKRVLIDPWLTGNPKAPIGADELGDLDVILVTHGHSDHTADIDTAAEERLARGDRVHDRAGRLAGGQARPRERRRHQQGRPGRGGRADGAHGARQPQLQRQRGRRHDHVPGRPDRLRADDRGRDAHLLRRRHQRVRRHGPDRPPLQAGRGRAADRRLLHDGPVRGGRGDPPAGRAAGSCPRTSAPSRALAGTPDQLREQASDVDGLEVLDIEPGGTIS